MLNIVYRTCATIHCICIRSIRSMSVLGSYIQLFVLSILSNSRNIKEPSDNALNNNQTMILSVLVHKKST